MYVADLLPFVLGFGILLHGGIRLGFRRPLRAGAPDRRTENRDGSGGAPLQRREDLFRLHRPPVLRLVLRRLRGDGHITFLLDYIELIRRGGAKVQATLSLLLEMAALKLPHTAQEVLPFAILFGTMLAFWRLTRNNELVVARAAGVSVWQFLTPAVLVALLVGIFAVTVFNPIASLTRRSTKSSKAASCARAPTSCPCRIRVYGCARATRAAIRS